MKRMMSVLVAAARAATPALAQQMGSADLKSAGALAFAPDGVLLVADPIGGAVFAITTGDASGEPKALKVEGLDAKIAAALGVSPGDILINDMAINPASGKAYLSVSRGKGPEAAPVIVTVDAAGKLAELSLKGLPFAKAAIPNPVAAGGRGRTEAITDLAFVDGRVIVAGLSSEEFSSNLRAIPYPFKAVDAGAGVEIYHGAHGKFETKSPVRTFAVYGTGESASVLAAYTCTPLVRFPLNDLKPGSKIRGTTVAELGNRNRPLDIVIYQKEGKDFALMTNNSRGVMKIPLENMEKIQGITDKVADKAGASYETIATLKGVVEMDLLNKDHAAILVRDGALNLKTIPLP
ncbi:MAG TPA: hypothetical protein VIE39_09635 [Thermoanaerobaculia bacterium]